MRTSCAWSRTTGRGVAGAVDFFTDLIEFLAGVRALGNDGFIGESGDDLLLAKVSADIAHVLFGQYRGQAEHDGIVAFAGFVHLQLAPDVLFVLAGKFRIQRDGGIAIHTMAGGAGAGFGLACFRITRLDRTGIHGNDRNGLRIGRSDSLLGNGAGEYQGGAQDEEVGELH